MTANAVIYKALEKFPYPCEPDALETEDGSMPEKYFTFNRADERGMDFGDNRPGCTLVSMQIHFFLPLKVPYLQEKKAIQEALFKNGFTYPVVTELTEPENNIRHIVFECDITEEREDS